MSDMLSEKIDADLSLEAHISAAKLRQLNELCIRHSWSHQAASTQRVAEIRQELRQEVVAAFEVCASGKAYAQCQDRFELPVAIALPAFLALSNFEAMCRNAKTAYGQDDVVKEMKSRAYRRLSETNTYPA